MTSIALLHLFDRIEGDAALRVLVLTGTGRAFSAGYDLNSVAERAASTVEQQSAGSAFEVVVNRLEELGVPTICRLNGGVYGGATDLALACDFRIGTDGCEMFMPAARLGLHYYPSGIARYASRLGVDNAKKLFLTAEKIDAAEMLRIGYLTALVPTDALDNGGRPARAYSGRQRPGCDARHEAGDQRIRPRQARPGRRRPPPSRQHARRRNQGRHQGVRGKAAAEVLIEPVIPGRRGLLRFARNDGTRHCEEHSDEAIHFAVNRDAPLRRRPGIHNHGIRIGRCESSYAQNRQWWLWIPGSRQEEARPGMTAIYSSTKVAVSAMLAREVR